jgi:hypothetical protein
MGAHKGVGSTPSQKGYALEKRWLKNKDKKIAKQKRKEAKKAAKLAKRKEQGKP